MKTYKNRFDVEKLRNSHKLGTKKISKTKQKIDVS